MVVEPSGTQSLKQVESATHESFCAHAVSAPQQFSVMQLLHAALAVVRPQVDPPPVPPIAGGAVHGMPDFVDTQSSAIGGRLSEQPKT